MKKMIFAASCALALIAGGAQAQERDLRIALTCPTSRLSTKTKMAN